VLRSRVEEALDRLILRFPIHVTRLLNAEDPMLSAEAAGIVSRLGLSGAVEGLIEAARRPEAIARRAAIEALGHIDSEEANRAIVAGLEDSDPAVRVAAVAAASRRDGPEAEEAIRRAVGARGFAARDAGEQMAFLKGLVALNGDAAVESLAELLTGRRWWFARHAPSLRAIAARALAIVGTPEAVEALQAARNDRTATVAHAVRASLRHIGHEPGSTSPLEGDEE
jgi:HEAT repeat protein